MSALHDWSICWLSARHPRGHAAYGELVLAVSVGVDQISIIQALGIYAFTMTVGLLMPLPIDFGVIDVSGVGALLASGVRQDVAIAIAGVGSVFLREELHKAVSSQRQHARV